MTTEENSVPKKSSDKVHALARRQTVDATHAAARTTARAEMDVMGHGPMGIDNAAVLAGVHIAHAVDKAAAYDFEDAAPEYVDILNMINRGEEWALYEALATRWGVPIEMVARVDGAVVTTAMEAQL